MRRCKAVVTSALSGASTYSTAIRGRYVGTLLYSSTLPVIWRLGETILMQLPSVVVPRDGGNRRSPPCCKRPAYRHGLPGLDALPASSKRKEQSASGHLRGGMVGRMTELFERKGGKEKSSFAGLQSLISPDRSREQLSEIHHKRLPIRFIFLSGFACPNPAKGKILP